MWPDRRLIELFKIEHPIVLAPNGWLGHSRTRSFSLRSRWIGFNRLRDDGAQRRIGDNSGTAAFHHQADQRQLLLSCTSENGCCLRACMA